jgi:hypothetical protein
VNVFGPDLHRIGGWRDMTLLGTLAQSIEDVDACVDPGVTHSSKR